MIGKPTAAQLRQLKRDNLVWPATLVPIPRAMWPVPGGVSDLKRFNALRSRSFLVQLFEEADGMVRMSVCRTEWNERANRWREDIGWDDLQRLKGEAGYADRCAVEVLPPDRLVVNVANMRHVFIYPAGVTLPFVWGSRA
jgi:hypothetical protein